MVRAVLLRLQTAFYACGRHGPHGAVQVEFGPLHLAQLASAQEHQRRKGQGRANGGGYLVGVNRAQQLAQLHRVGDGRAMLGYGQLNRALQVARRVARTAAMLRAEAEDSAGRLQCTVSGFRGAATMAFSVSRFDAIPDNSTASGPMWACCPESYPVSYPAQVVLSSLMRT